MSPTTQRRRTRMRTGLLCSLLGLALLCFAPSAQAGLLEDINSQRASGGLPEVHASDPIARSAAQELSSNTGENRSTIMDPDRRNSDEYDFEENRFCGCDDVRTENSGFWRLRADWSLEKNLRAAPYARAVLFDPRVTTLDVVEDRQIAVVAVTFLMALALGWRRLRDTNAMSFAIRASATLPVPHCSGVPGASETPSRRAPTSRRTRPCDDRSRASRGRSTSLSETS